MSKLWNLQIVRNVTLDEQNESWRSLVFSDPPLLPALQSLTVSAFGDNEDWHDLLNSKEPKPISCPAVQHLRLLPSRPHYILCTIHYFADDFLFPNLVSLEIPAVHLNRIYKIIPNLKRLTLTLPTRDLHKHLFDVSITAYGEQVCAAILATPNADPLKIREEIAEENERHPYIFKEWDLFLMELDNLSRPAGRRPRNLTFLTGLEELRLKSDTGDWGPTVVSCRDLLNMRSLKTIVFCGFNPKYIPDKMMRKLRKQFTVLTPNSAHAVDFNSKIKPPKQNRLQELLGAAWKQVFGRLRTSSLQNEESCSKASGVSDDLSKKPGLLSISRRDIIQPDSFRQWLYSHPEFPPPVSIKLPRIRTFKICINPNFQPLGYHLNSLLESQRDSLETLHISCLGLKLDCLEIELPGMNKLRDLQIIRNIKVGNDVLDISLQFAQPPVVPVLETLTLSSFGFGERWDDFLGKPAGNEVPGHPTCETVEDLRFLPSRPSYLTCMLHWIKRNIFFPNLVSLEIPAVLLALFYTLPSTPDSLQRLTLTLPTRGLHKHLFDACITGYGEQVCAAILADPDRDPAEIREEIEQENLQQVDWENRDPEYVCVKSRIQQDYLFRHQGLRITNFIGLEELWIKSDTGDWGPTVVSCPDLLSMESLKILRFCGHKPKYIPEDMIEEMKERFTVVWD